MKKTKKKISKKLKKIIRRYEKFELDSPASRKIFLGFLIVFFLVADLAVWSSANIGLIQPSEPEPKIMTRLEIRARKLARGHPMEVMIPHIATKDKKVASFVLAIAKKESNLGTFSPKKDGRDCFNYWGYRGQYNTTDSGYSCFDSPRQAVNVISERVEDLIAKDIDTPKKMAVWKCGYDCSWDNQRDVKKWVTDVDYYYRRMVQ